MSWLFALVWFAGGAPVAVLNAVMRAESPRVVRRGRIAFALVLGIDLLFAVILFSLGNANTIGVLNATRSIWWVTVVLGGIPLALVSGLAVRRGYAGHRVALASAVSATAVLYLAFPLGFVPVGQTLTGLGRFEHDHHVLDVLFLLIPSLILLASEVLRAREPIEEEPADDVSILSRLQQAPRGAVVRAALVLVLLIALSGTSAYGTLIGLGAVAVALTLFLWQKHRSAVRRALRDLGSPSGRRL